jgi:hypothetical protein
MAIPRLSDNLCLEEVELLSTPVLLGPLATWLTHPVIRTVAPENSLLME